MRARYNEIKISWTSTGLNGITPQKTVLFKLKIVCAVNFRGKTFSTLFCACFYTEQVI
jgi:hypothetical protein